MRFLDSYCTYDEKAHKIAMERDVSRIRRIKIKRSK
jgi:hypothetical protein